MANYKYLIIGGGMTADAAARGIRELDPSGSIGVIAAESDPPYDRPPLSKALWTNADLDIIWCNTRETGATLLLGRKAVSLDPAARRVTDDRGETHVYEKLLLATGGSPRRLPYGGDGVIYYRTLADYRKLRQASAAGRSFAVVGGGFIGTEIAAALSMNNKKVSLLFPESGVGARVFPQDVSQFLTGLFRDNGVEVLAGEMLENIEPQAGGYLVTTQSGRKLQADGVVAGLGITPNVELAAAAGLELGNGVRVDEQLRTSQADIYAAGDVAEVFSPALGKFRRVEHEDNTLRMGRQAGRNMAGAAEPYLHLPSFYSDLFDVGYEAVGDLDARLTVVADWVEPYQEGVLYYLEGGRVRGVLLWNVWEQVPAARALVAEPGPFTPADLKGRIPG
jgi:3-phenylpropionate/trans-cinnamate dioxygenase ferredoxin reductase component